MQTASAYESPARIWRLSIALLLSLLGAMAIVAMSAAGAFELLRVLAVVPVLAGVVLASVIVLDDLRG